MQQGDGNTQQREIYFGEALEFDLEFDETHSQVVVSTESKPTQVFYENHVKNGHSILE